ncbi:MAG TPA: MarP family serine protease [Candidatus Limnocylindrales bacterium]|nr:MarP family serine protease [Candidatus Limnocylindrales bacterium]
MNPLDLIAVLLVIVALILGARSGAIPQVGGLLGAVAGGALAVKLLPVLGDPLAQVDPTLRPWLVLGGLIGAVALGESLGAAIGRWAVRGLGTGFLSAADRFAGATLGAVQALLIVWLTGGLLAEGPLPRFAEAAGSSVVVRTMSNVLPPPTEFAVELRTWLDESGLPDVFIGFEPLPAPPVQRPGDAAAEAIAAGAVASTLKVAAATCGLSSLGTGFVVRSDYVLTNAHVVAGATSRGIRVATTDGRLLDATPVLFDPDLDVALLHVADLRLRALPLATTDPGRGSVGATLGYPNGGQLTVLAAAVAGRYPATGYDIYGEDQVRREILELRAAIERGDSGGPFVLSDGTVGGVVFAEARTNPDVGYALSPTAVASAIAAGLGQTAAVSTGDCLN